MTQVQNDAIVQTNEPSVNLVTVDLNNVDLPDLDDAEVLPLELSSLYWTPEASGETKRVYFDCIKMREMPSMKEGEPAQILPCAFFYEKVDGDVVAICNASKRLVAAIEGSFIKRGTPLIIEYQGKKKNATNQFHSDIWSIKPLVPKHMLIAESVADEIKQNGNKEELSMDTDHVVVTEIPTKKVPF